MESLKVLNYLNPHPIIFTLEMPVAEAVEKLIEGKQTGGPVVDARRGIVGFISEQDCLRQMIESSYYREQVARVKDIMQQQVKSVKPYDSVLEVAQRLLSDRVKVYPVVNDDGSLVGTINRTQILTAIDVQLQNAYKAVPA